MRLVRARRPPGSAVRNRGRDPDPAPRFARSPLVHAGRPDGGAGGSRPAGPDGRHRGPARAMKRRSRDLVLLAGRRACVLLRRHRRRRDLAARRPSLGGQRARARRRAPAADRDRHRRRRAAFRPRHRATGPAARRAPTLGPVAAADPDAAFELRKAEVEAAPDDWRAWYRLAVAYGDARDTARGRRAMRKAIALQRAARISSST